MPMLPWRDPPLTEQEAIDLVMLTLLDDYEGPSWVIGGSLQVWCASGFAHSLRNHAREQRLPWYVASMLPIAYTDRPFLHRRIFAPHALVAFAPDHAREVFDATTEGGFPPFVLEIASPLSAEHDRQEKRHAYALFGVQEYALFTPREGGHSALEGYRRDPAGAFIRWPLDKQGRLWSAILGLFLIVRGPLLQAQTPEGQILLTPEQANDAYRRAEEARRNAEDEVERLKRELARLRGDN